MSVVVLSSGFSLKDRGNRVLRNTGMYLPAYTVSRPRKKTPCSLLWKSQFCLGLFVYIVNLKSTFIPKMWEN